MKKQMGDAAQAFGAAHRGAVGKTMAAIEEKLLATNKRKFVGACANSVTGCASSIGEEDQHQ